MIVETMLTVVKVKTVTVETVITGCNTRDNCNSGSGDSLDGCDSSDRLTVDTAGIDETVISAVTDSENSGDRWECCDSKNSDHSYWW